MIEEHDVTIKVPFGYEILVNALLAALDRAAKGKGRKRHAKHDNQDLKQQDLYNFSHDWRMDQIRKKAGEVRKLSRRDKPLEVLDIIVYAAVEYDILMDELSKDIARRH